MTRCPHCPCPEGRTCLAISTRHPRLCELVLTRPDYAALVANGGHVAAAAATLTEAEAARLRRAAKPRVPLGVRPKGG